MWCGRVAVSFLLSGLASAAWINNISNRDLCVNTPLRVRGCGRPHLFEVELPEEPASPWTFKPQCINSTFGSPQLCVFTSHEFANGRGISIITTPSTAAAIQNLTSFTQSGNLTKAGEMAVPPFEVRDLPGRGKGGIANTTLHRGDRLLAATPAILVDMRVNRFLNVMDGIMLETIAVRQLPPQANEMFWELHNQPTTNSVRDRITVNAFAVEVAGWQFSGVVLETSRFNHDCRPNSAYYFDEETLTHYTHASTEINPGTEISLTYISPLAPQQHRQNTLRVSWGFKCTCSQCSMHPKMIKHSDTRIEHINNMTRLLYGWHERWTARLDLTDAAAVAAADTKKPVVKDEQQAKKHEEAQQKAMDEIPVISNVEAIATAETVISLYQQERLVVYSSDAHLIAALANCAEGRRTEAIKHAQLALETGLVHEGLDDELHVDVVKLGVDPTKEPCWLKKGAGSSLSDAGEVAESS